MTTRPVGGADAIDDDVPVATRRGPAHGRGERRPQIAHGASAADAGGDVNASGGAQDAGGARRALRAKSAAAVHDEMAAVVVTFPEWSAFLPNRAPSHVPARVPFPAHVCGKRRWHWPWAMARALACRRRIASCGRGCARCCSVDRWVA